MTTFDSQQIDAILVLSFGGPNGPDDVIPFLENVLRGKRVPRERMLEVAEHYQHFGGISPINDQNKSLISALENELTDHDIQLPIYWGNRNWHPLLQDTLSQMYEDGIRNALCFVTSIFSSYSGCRQYLEDLDQARNALQGNAPETLKLRSFFNHPLFIETEAQLVQSSLDSLSAEQRQSAKVLFTAHSIPLAMAEGCAYESQLRESCRLVCASIDVSDWELVYQSRSGPPMQPWLEPDVCDRVRGLDAEGVRAVVVVPIGFISDHMEVLFDLDTELAQVCEEIGIHLERVPTVGTHAKFIEMIRNLVEEQIGDQLPLAVGQFEPRHVPCPTDCCPIGNRHRPEKN